MTEVNARKETLLAASKAGHFLEAVYRSLRADRKERDDLALDVAALHNEGQVDVLAAFDQLERQSPNGPDFFMTRHVLEKALPHLDSPVLPVMRCVLRLQRDAGQDIAGGTIIEGYVAFCAKEPSRPRAALKEIEACPDQFADLLPATIAAGSRIDNPEYLAEALRLCEHGNIELRRRAVYAVGRVHWREEAVIPEEAIAALERSVSSETDDLILAGVIKSAFALLQRNKTWQEPIIALTGAALAKGDEYTLHAGSEVFGFYTNEIPPPLLDVFISQLTRVKPENKGTLDMIDDGIAHLLRKNSCERGQAIRFLEDFLIAHSDKLELDTFDNAASEIHRGPALLSKVLTRWFLRGNQVLCKGMHAIAARNHRENLRIEIDPAELAPPTAERAIFVARKALGYLIFQPVSAASVLISLMRHAQDDLTLRELGALLLDPLLLSFTGSAREYVAEQSTLENGKVKETLDHALKAIDDYLEVLRSIGTLSALHPSESQRETQHRHFSRQMAESWKAVEAQSTILNLFPKSLLLYGRKSIHYVFDGPGAPPRRMETPLTSHGTEIEYPRMEYIDPYGLDYIIRLFRMERMHA